LRGDGDRDGQRALRLGLHFFGNDGLVARLMADPLAPLRKHRPEMPIAGVGIVPVINCRFCLGGSADRSRHRQNGNPPKPSGQNTNSIPDHANCLRIQSFQLRCYGANKPSLAIRFPTLDFRPERSKKASHYVKPRRYPGLPRRKPMPESVRLVSRRYQ
jgi:hypothetical protein